MIDSTFMASIENAEVLETFCKAERHLKQHDRILCSVSGGSDSDIMIDILSHCEGWSKVTFVFFDTGVEYEATKRHLEYLEKRYGIKILQIKAKPPIPSVIKRHGQPLISKHASENIGRLQRHGFKRTGCAGCPFNRKVIEELSLIEKYEPKLYKACTNMFADSYEYTAKFREFQAEFLRQRKADKEAAKYYDLLDKEQKP